MLRIALVFLLLLATRPAAAQTVVGQLEEEGSGRPVHAAFVVLVDGAGRGRAGVLSDSAGRFVLRAPEAGTYRLRVEQIGQRSAESAPLALEAGRSHPFHMVVPRTAINLAAIEVEGERRCRIRPEEGETTALLWEEARKALAVAGWGEETARHFFVLRRYEREYDPRTGEVRGERIDSTAGYSRIPIRSLPADSLMRRGFVVMASGGAPRFYGPDASVLLSDAFLDAHCLRVRTDDDRPDLLGLGFEPGPGRKVPDIAGVLWLDRQSAELRHLEFEYRNLPFDVSTATLRPGLHFGGRADFDRLPTGAWIIRRWWLRGPRLAHLRPGDLIDSRRMRGARKPSHTSRDRIMLAVREDGEEVVRVIPPRERAIAADAPGAVRGVVFDTTGVRPLAGAEVYVSGTAYAATADSLGRFALDSLPAGVHSVGFRYPALEARGLYPRARAVRVAAGSTTEGVILVPHVEPVRPRPERAGASDPTLVEPALELAELALESRDDEELEQARDALARSLRAGVDAARMHRLRSEVEAALGDAEAAAGAALRALALDSADARALRLLAAAWLRQPGREAEGAEAYFAGVAAMDSAAAELYHHDVALIADDQEARAWERAADMEARRAWLRRFWETRAARDATSVADRLAAHYRRLDYAYRRYFSYRLTVAVTDLERREGTVRSRTFTVR